MENVLEYSAIGSFGSTKEHNVNDFELKPPSGVTYTVNVDLSLFVKGRGNIIAFLLGSKVIEKEDLILG